MASGVVGDEGHGDAIAFQLPGRQARPLQPRPGLVYPDVDALSLLVGGADHPQSGAVVHRGQSAGVAVGQDVVSIFDQLRSVSSHALVDLHVFVGDALGLGHQCVRYLLHLGVLGFSCLLQHPLQGPREVNGRRAGLL